VRVESSTTDVELSTIQLDRRVPRRAAHRGSWAQMAIATDAAMLGVALILTGLLARGAAPPLSLSWALVLGLITLVTLHRRGLYRPPLQLSIVDAVRAIVTATAVATAVTISLRVILTDSATIAEPSIRLWILATAFLTIGRLALTVHERRGRRAGTCGAPTLIVGAGKVGHLLAKRLDENKEFGLRPIGFLDKEPLPAETNGSAPAVIGASWDLDRVVGEYHVEHVVFTFSSAPTEVYLRLLKRCEELGVRTSLVPRLFEKATTQASVESLGGLPLVTSHARHPRGWEFSAKYALDRLAAVVMIAFLSPLFAALAAAVWISLGRPIFFRQERIGMDGKRFQMLKFRSMRPPVKGEDEPLSLDDDSAPGGVEGADRRTRVGALMRKLSLDELPQLVNVAKGEMSFVGPRPERPEFVEVFAGNVHRYDERHRVKSGITGWAQVHGLRGRTSIADRAEWDNYYIENWSLWLDLKVMLLTFAAVLRPGEVE
jgi:exopolysaccharide biosynthesis polyprenyl glycosylphosphotransferase